MSQMTRSFAALSAAVFALAICSVPAWSQTTEEAPVEENDLAMGEPETTTPKPGDTYVRETIGDWAIRCVVTGSGDDRCQLYQLLEDPEGQPIAEFTLIKLPEGAEATAAATIIVPLETSLRDELSIRVDEQNGKRYPFAFCNPVGCYARIGLTEAEIEEYKRGAEAILTIVPIAAPDARVTVPASLTGFTAAFEAL